jgi:hypothetical protein
MATTEAPQMTQMTQVSQKEIDMCVDKLRYYRQCRTFYLKTDTGEMFRRARMFYELRSIAKGYLKHRILTSIRESGEMCDNEFISSFIDNEIKKSAFNKICMNNVQYSKSPDQHDEALALLCWDLVNLPCDMLLERLEFDRS